MLFADRAFLHLMLHIFVPALAAWVLYRKIFFQAWGIMLATMIVDADHLLADPVFDPNRCSIGFHPLHSAAATGLYALMTFVPQSRNLRITGLGLLIHMVLDGADCLFMK
ncbi:MAG: DUF6122 family protein [Desulfococcaceae bacterium]